MKSYESDRDQRYSQNGKPLGEQLEKKNRKQDKKRPAATGLASLTGPCKMPTQNTSSTGSPIFCTPWILKPRKVMCFNRDSQPNLGSLIQRKLRLLIECHKRGSACHTCLLCCRRGSLGAKKANPFKTVHEYQTGPLAPKGPNFVESFAVTILKFSMFHKELRTVSLHWAPQIVQLVYSHFLFVL